MGTHFLLSALLSYCFADRLINIHANTILVMFLKRKCYSYVVDDKFAYTCEHRIVTPTAPNKPSLLLLHLSSLLHRLLSLYLLSLPSSPSIGLALD